ncbi:MAG: extracellular solute-binding protein [Oscillospiraceae bacterium]|nr:extracellular solute-binding protein [Oscillospiraceae bacterium]
MKQTAAMILIFALALIFLISCSAPEKSVEQENKGETGDISKTGDTEETKPEFIPAEGTGYGGYKFTILGYDGKPTGTWQIAAISEIMAEQDTGEPLNDAVYKRNRDVEALYDIEFDIVPVTYPNRGDFAAKFTKAVLAGDDLFDAAFLLGDSLPAALSKKNTAFDLFSIPSLDLSKSWWDQNSVKAMSIGGRLSAVIGDVNLYSAIAPMAIFTNKKLMQDYSVGDLYQMVRDGKWTWDAMYGIAKQATKDLNGDGVIDKNDQVGFVTQYIYLQTAVTSAGEYLTPKNDEDIPVFEPNTERIAGIVDKVVPILKDKNTTVAAEDITAGYNNVFFDFIMPKFRDNEIMFHSNQLLFSFELRSMNADFAILPIPKYDENQKQYGAMVANAWATYTVIPVTCTDTERAGNVLSAMGYYSKQYVMPAYYDVTVTNKLIRDEDSMEMLDIILNNRILDLSYLYNWGEIGSLFGGISNSGKADTFVSQFEKAEAKINNAIQKTLDELEGN